MGENENNSNAVYDEKFKNIDKKIEDLTNKTALIKEKADQNENGRLIQTVANALVNLEQYNHRKDTEKVIDDEKKERDMEKQNQIITKISEDLVRCNNKIDSLETKVDNKMTTLETKVDNKMTTLETKFTKFEVGFIALEKKFNESEDKTKIDTSLMTKKVITVSSGVIISAIVLFILKFVFKIF